MNKLKYGGRETRTVADDGRIVMSFVMRGGRGQRLPEGSLNRFQGPPERLLRDKPAWAVAAVTYSPVPPVLNTARSVSHPAARPGTLYRSVCGRGTPAAARTSRRTSQRCGYMLLRGCFWPAMPAVAGT